jgi:prepilin-type N-terminal cleavage/methylation domain-containing protein
MKRLSLKGGFTLLELLVVVAIIGIITALVLVALSSARNKGGDAAVKSNLATVRSRAEIFYSENSESYLPPGGSTRTKVACPVYVGPTGTNIFTYDKTIADAIAEAKLRGSGVTSCVNSATTWAVAVGLKTNSGQSWCVDSTGQSKQYNGVPSIAINDTNNPTFFCN